MRIRLFSLMLILIRMRLPKGQSVVYRYSCGPWSGTYVRFFIFGPGGVHFMKAIAVDCCNLLVSEWWHSLYPDPHCDKLLTYIKNQNHTTFFLKKITGMKSLFSAFNRNLREMKKWRHLVIGHGWRLRRRSITKILSLPWTVSNEIYNKLDYSCPQKTKKVKASREQSHATVPFTEAFETKENASLFSVHWLHPRTT